MRGSRILQSNNRFWQARMASRALLGGMVLLMPYATLFPGTGPPQAYASYIHFISMAGLAFLACVGFKSIHIRIAAVFFIFTLSASMELIQHFLTYRHGTIADVYINGMGCLAGVGVFMVIVFCCQKLNNASVNILHKKNC